jgi:crossover junction endodeoxyribonuclease RusA
MAIGARGKQFRKETLYLAARQVDKRDHFAADKKIYLSVAVFAPDRRKRDLDNIFKAMNDVLTHAGIYADDSKID